MSVIFNSILPLLPKNDPVIAQNMGASSQRPQFFPALPTPPKTTTYAFIAAVMGVSAYVYFNRKRK